VIAAIAARIVFAKNEKGRRSRQHEFPPVENCDEWGSHFNYDVEEIKI